MRKRIREAGERPPVGDAGIVRRRSTDVPAVQRALEVGAADDPFERAADATAAQVMRRLRALPAGGARVPEVAEPDVQRSADAPAPAGAAGAFTAPAEVDRGIADARGSGRPIDPAVRSRFEQAMGTDLSGVRVHDGPKADRLSRSISARAFTTGHDIFFSQGAYDPRSEAGQQLLAHELAHTVQQSGSARRMIRRLTVRNTDFSKVTSVKVLSGGGSGQVAEFTDGVKPIIVKVDQMVGNEVVVAANMLAEAVGGAGGKVPETRVATPKERQEIAAATQNHLEPGCDPRNFVKRLAGNYPTIIAERMPGKTLKEVIKDDEHVRKSRFLRKEKLDPKSILTQLVNAKGPLGILGQVAAVDVILGNGDRYLELWNPENFMYDEQDGSFSFVDNTQRMERSLVASLDFGGGQVTTGKKGFELWAGWGLAKELRDDAAGIADRVFGLMFTKGILKDAAKGSTLRKLLTEAVKKNEGKLKATIAKGLTDGLAKSLAALKDPLKVTNGVEADKRLEAVQSMLAKRYFLEGAAADKAWTDAGVEAAKLVPAPAVWQAAAGSRNNAPKVTMGGRTPPKRTPPVPPPKPAHLRSAPLGQKRSPNAGRPLPTPPVRK